MKNQSSFKIIALVFAGFMLAACDLSTNPVQDKVDLSLSEREFPAEFDYSTKKVANFSSPKSKSM